MEQLTEKFLSNTFGDKYLFSVNREDFTRKSAANVYQSKLQPSFFKDNTLHIVIGTDSGLLPAYLLEKGIPKGARYLFIEPESILRRIKSMPAFSSNRIHLGSPETAFDTLNEESDLGEGFYFSLGNVLTHRSIAATELHLEAYEDIYNQVDEEQIFRATFHRQNSNTSLHKTNMLLNAATSFYTANSVKGIFQDKTAVIIAPGPSLTDHLDWIKSNRRNLVVISISRVSTTLVQHGITPDIIASIDPILLNYEQSTQMLTFTNSIFVHASHCNFNMTSLWPDNKISIGTLIPWDTKLNQKTIESRGFTVSNTAIDLAAWLGVNQIVLLGMDMCLSNSGDMYTKSEANHAYPITTRFNKVVTNSGESTMTIPDYVKSATCIEAQALELQEKNVRIINPSKQAMRINLVEHITTDKIKLSDLEQPALDTIKEKLHKPNKVQHWKMLEKEIQGMIKRLQDVDKRIKSGQSIIKKIKSGKQTKSNPYTQLRKINGHLAENDAATFVKSMEWMEFAKISLILEADQDDSTIQGQERYFEIFADSLKKTKELLQLPMQYINLLRREHHAPAEEGPNIETWKQFLDQLPFPSIYDANSICFRWAQLHPEKLNQTSQEKQVEINASSDTFLESTGSHVTSGKSVWSKKQMRRNLASALTLLHKFQEEKDIEGIEFLISALGRYPQESVSAYIHLCKGLKAEFLKNIPAAIEAYQAIFEIPDAETLPQALKQIYGICLDRSDIDNAIVALEALSEISPPHLAPYADILALQGDSESATENYKKYLAHFPSDPDIPNRLAEILLKAGKTDELIEICDNLLDRNPNSALIREIKESALPGKQTPNDKE